MSEKFAMTDVTLVQDEQFSVHVGEKCLGLVRKPYDIWYYKYLSPTGFASGMAGEKKTKEEAIQALLDLWNEPESARRYGGQGKKGGSNGNCIAC